MLLHRPYINCADILMSVDSLQQPLVINKLRIKKGLGSNEIKAESDTGGTSRKLSRRLCNTTH